jgi:1-acyl-sn-glycerol-3-phosphate acyltransferase
MAGWSPAFYGAVRAFARFGLRFFTWREEIGAENVPHDPPYILVTNHLSVFDLPLLLTICPHVVRAFAADKHRRNLFYAPLLALFGAIWVRRGDVDRQALRQALDVLARGEVLGMAPEGTRARGIPALQKGKSGAAYLATRADVPIVPVAVSGTENIMQNLARLQRTDVRVVVGEPFRLPENGRVRSQKLAEYTDLIMHRIAELLPEEYRGLYARSGAAPASTPAD